MRKKVSLFEHASGRVQQRVGQARRMIQAGTSGDLRASGAIKQDELEWPNGRVSRSRLEIGASGRTIERCQEMIWRPVATREWGWC